MADREWKVGIYMRLSIEDGEDKVESNSITNQRELIKWYLKNNKKLKLCGEYVDDGYSGTTFDRPGFQSMFSDIVNGKINTVVVKDLSRLGRNYIEAGNYIEQIFPLYNVRFIAINDNIDSYKDPNSVNGILVPFKNLLNDEYARDISNKIKSVCTAKRKRGEYLGGTPLYGYIKDPNNKYKLIIDEEAAEVVSSIFQKKLEGKGNNKIIQELNEAGIPTPQNYRAEKFNVRRITDGSLGWRRDTIQEILRNEMYCGDMVQGKKKVISYKDHRKRDVPKEDWIVVRDTHEPIISRDVFEKIQTMLVTRDTRIDSNGELYMFSGFLRCHDCHRTMTKKNSRSKTYVEENGKKRYVFYCSAYIRSGTRECTKHKVRSDELEDCVFKAIKLQIDLVLNMEDVIQEIVRQKKIDYNISVLERSITENEKKIEKFKLLKKSVYEDWKLGVISQDEYMEYSQNYETEMEHINERIEDLNKKIKSDKRINSNAWIEQFRKHKNISELNREVIQDLIDYIDVSEDGSLTVNFKYADEYKRALEFVKNNK